MTQQHPGPQQPYSGPPPQQPYSGPPPQRRPNKALWIVVAVLGAAVLLVLGIFIGGVLIPGRVIPTPQPPPPSSPIPMSGWIEFQLNGLPDDAETTLYVTYPGGQPELKVARGAKLNLIELDPGSYQVDFGESVADGVHYYPLDHTPGQPITVQVTESDNFVVAHYAPLVLTFEGVGKLRLGMTMDEAKAADPSVQVGHSDEYYGGDCGGGFSNDIEAMAFNPDGKLAWIVVKDYVATEKGIRKGSSGKYIAAAYTLKSKNYTKEGYSGVTVNSTGAEDEDGKLPLLVLSLGNSGKNVGEMEGEIASATVDWIALDGGQQCFD